MSTTDISAVDATAGTSAPIVSVKPVVIAAPDRGDDLQVRVWAPVTGDRHGVAETTDESPERAALIQRLTTAYLRTALGVDASSFATASAAAAQSAGSTGRLDSK